jgi:hypothetical protein
MTSGEAFWLGAVFGGLIAALLVYLLFRKLVADLEAENDNLWFRLTSPDEEGRGGYRT